MIVEEHQSMIGLGVAWTDEPRTFVTGMRWRAKEDGDIAQGVAFARVSGDPGTGLSIRRVHTVGLIDPHDLDS